MYDLAGTDLNFVHKRLLGAAKSFVTSGLDPKAALLGFARGGGGSIPPVRTGGLAALPAQRFAPRFERGGRRFAATPARRSAITRAMDAATARGDTAAAAAFRRELGSVGALRLARPITRIASGESMAPRPVSRIAGQQRCGLGFVRGPDGRCVRRGREIFDPLGLFGGPPRQETTAVARQRGGFQAVEGAFGMPAMVPEEQMRVTLVCPRGMVLGDDNLCYPKAVLPRRSKFRKWRGEARPVVSAADAKAIRRAASARDRVLKLAKDVGLHASKTKPKTSPKRSQHQHLLAPPQLRVISEETN